MAERHLTREGLAGKVIDGHSHVGVGLKQYCRLEYPYAQTVEGIYYQQLAGGVDVNVVFPFSFDLYCEPRGLLAGRKQPAAEPLSPAPFASENRLLLREALDFCPELSERFLPFVCIDPARAAAEQLVELEALAGEYPIYGIKVNPVGCQSRAIDLLGPGEELLDFAERHGLPLLFHAVTAPGDEYSQASDILKIVDRRPGLRFCLAHSLLFHRGYLDRARDADNVWVDTAAMKIQVDLVNDLVREGSLAASDLIDADFSDHRKVLAALCQQYPETIIWGTDTPAYSYICRRRQAEGATREFAYKSRYEWETDALHSLPAALRQKVANANTLDFLFGRA